MTTTFSADAITDSRMHDKYVEWVKYWRHRHTHLKGLDTSCYFPSLAATEQSKTFGAAPTPWPHADEIKILWPQWVCTDNDRRPLTCSGGFASITDRTKWALYNACKATAYPHVGFVLTAIDPYTIVALDATTNIEQLAIQQRLLKSCDSYAETGPGGEGYHIIVKGVIPYNICKNGIEMHSSRRYVIFTGQHVNTQCIEHRQEWLDELYTEMSRP